MTPRIGSQLKSFAVSLAIAGSTAGLAACGAAEDGFGDGLSINETIGAGGMPAAGVSCPARGPLVTPAMPSGVVPPAGAELFLRLYAEGTQNYTCQAGMNGGYAWTFKAPVARLYSDNCVLVGSHFAGPTWKIEKDGSAVIGKKMSEAAATLSGAIPWLLLETTKVDGQGALAGAAYINRVDTVGGVAPTDGCDAARVGTEIEVPYTSTYLYYRLAAKPASSAPSYPY
jgi:Protein of unknown function (DUF3455)